MQTGSLAWWMAMDRVRERSEAAGVVFPATTLIACPWRESSYLVVSPSDPEGPDGGQDAVGAVPVVPDGGARDILHQAALVRRPLAKGHLRLARRRMCRRQGGLAAEDFTLLWRCLQGRDALAIIPARRESWDETPRTVDLLPLPLHPQVALPAASALIHADLRNQMGCVPGWTFPHRIAAVSPDWLAQPENGGRIAWVLYLRMRRSLQGKRGDSDFHLLVTRRWMWLVPCPVGAALEYAGVFSVTSSTQWEGLMRTGPWAGLAEVVEEEASLCG